ncbi:hypothetical protein TVAG_202800 [Trichomonas vaginalis G3]|uniref:Surface antigen BspA-like n=1 Tax=Trichomonas vaginalis (strain ATCC PRA-98 / G3) TaxID=412133 RepID=A2ENF2_TRIV3|nr:hypothetical protein TVAG_202800 [Trichomonas vaginalis G3]|eukprot:XP_001318045.1 hypothetical protein [Trichomonas vaginalis G3]
MLLFLLKLSFCNRFDDYGVEFNDDFTTLIKTPDRIPDNYVILSSCVTISGGSSSLKSSFANCLTTIKSISFGPNSQLQTIFSYVFNGSSIESIDFSNCMKITTIPEFCFAYCYKLTSVNLPPKLLYLEAQCFHTCNSLTYIQLPDSLLELRSNFHGPFSAASRLSRVDISENSQLRV